MNTQILIEILLPFLLLIGIILLIKESLRLRISGWLFEKSVRWLLIFSIFAVFQMIFLAAFKRWEPFLLLGCLFYFALPIFWIFFHKIKPDKISTQYIVLLVILIWFPLEIGWIEKNYFHVFIALIYSLLIFPNIPKLLINLNWSLKKAEWLMIVGFWAGMSAVAFAVTSVFDLAEFGLSQFFSDYPIAVMPIALMFFFAVALPAELIFRGVMQGIAFLRFRPSAAIFIGAIMFGLVSINKPEGSFPNWESAIVSVLTGMIYGYVYHRTRSLLATTLLHALVAFSWWALIIL